MKPLVNHRDRPLMVDLKPLAGPALAFFLAASLLYFGLADDRGKLCVLSLDACVLCALAYSATARLMPRVYAPRLLILGSALQLVALFAIAALGLPLSPPYHVYEADISDAPLRVLSPLLIVSGTTLLVAAAWYVTGRLTPGNTSSPFAGDDDEAIRKERRVYLILAAAVHLLYWPSTMEAAGMLGYAGRIVATALLVAPFLAGRDATRDRRLSSIWWFTIGLNAAIGIAAGTRSKAFVPAVLFLAGYVSALPVRRRIVAASIAAILTIPLIQVAGALGVVRDELGRDTIDVMREDRVHEMFARIWLMMTSPPDRNAEETRVHGVSRLLSWTNVVVPLLTPDSLPYRGFDGFLDEIAGTFQIATLSGLTVDDFYDAGLLNAPARRYGFSVNANTSVEFTLAADGWSRGGALVVLTFSAIAVLAMILMECMGAWIGGRNSGVQTILALGAAKAALFDASALPFLVIVRSVVVSTLVLVVLATVVEAIRRVIRRGRPVPVLKGVQRPAVVPAEILDWPWMPPPSSSSEATASASERVVIQSE